MRVPIRIHNSVVHFALRGRLLSGFELLVVSANCPVTLYNAMPSNSADKTSGRLARIWFNTFRGGYNWAYSGSLPIIEVTATPGEQYKPTGNDSQEDTGFQPESRLQFAWRAYSSKRLRSNVQEQLDRQKLDLCKAILAKDELSVANALAPIILECEGYSIGNLGN